VEIDDPIVASDGTCALHVAPSCPAGCPGASYCASDGVCAPLPDVVDVDGGEVDTTGSSAQPEIRLWFVDGSTGYASAPPPGPALLFSGGERLSIGDAAAGFAFHADVPAPLPVDVTAPDLTRPDVSIAGALEIDWAPASAEQMVVLLSASSRVPGGGSAWIRCVTADLGQLVIPASMTAALPVPPRDLRLEVERDEEHLVPVARDGASGLGVLVHVAFTAWKNWSE
jgi:hypothetical protein